MCQLRHLCHTFVVTPVQNILSLRLNTMQNTAILLRSYLIFIKNVQIFEETILLDRILLDAALHILKQISVNTIFHIGKVFNVSKVKMRNTTYLSTNVPITPNVSRTSLSTVTASEQLVFSALSR